MTQTKIANFVLRPPSVGGADLAMCLRRRHLPESPGLALNVRSDKMKHRVITASGISLILLLFL